jgi:polyhydroxybutyrate depolymerase
MVAAHARRSTRLRLTSLASLGLAAFMLASCGGNGGRGAHAVASTTPLPAATARSGCGAAPPTSGAYTVELGKHTRTFVLHLPSGYSDSTAIALVVNLHGSGATALDQEAFSGMDATADAEDFVVVYPQGLIAEGSGFDWNVPGEPLVGGAIVPRGSADDVTYLTSLVQVLEQHLCVDPREVYATGFSGGARMASQLACDASSVFAAVAPVSGLRHPMPCPTARPVPVVAFHGTADPVDPFGGDGEAYWTYSVPEAASRWGRQDGCSTHTTAPFATSAVTLTTYGRCHGGADVQLYAISREGHEWPGGPKVPASLSAVLGPQSNAIDANSTMWTFFKAHPLPG